MVTLTELKKRIGGNANGILRGYRNSHNSVTFRAALLDRNALFQFFEPVLDHVDVR